MHLIVFNLYQPSIESVEYWLQAVKHRSVLVLLSFGTLLTLLHRAGDKLPYIVLIGTHADRFHSEVEIEAALSECRMRITRRFKEAESQLGIRGAIAVSFPVSTGSSNASLRNLHTVIAEAGASLNRRLLPATFFALQKKIVRFSLCR